MQVQIPRYSKPIFIVGFGGAKLGLYNNFAFPEEEIYASLDRMFNGITIPPADRFTILLVHDPPMETALDFTFIKTHAGSVSVRRIIEKWQPNLAVAGHIHESPGIVRLGSTLTINAGEAKFNHFATISVGDSGIDASLH